MTTPTPSVVVVPPDVLATIHGHVEDGDPLETGGILLGHTDAATLDVTAAGGPGPRAVRRPDFFLRDLDHAKDLAAIAWERGQGQWIGEWHTHPHGPAHPSRLDLRTYARLVTDPELGFTAFLSLIVTPVEMTAWAVIAADHFGLIQLTIS